jgi:PKD repeat protein
MKFYLPKRVLAGMIFILLTGNIFSQTFTEVTAIALPGLSNGSVAWGDYDNDGDYDMLVSGFGSDDLMVLKIFRNNGGNSFTDQAGIFLTAIPVSYNSYVMTTAQWADFDNDGYLDVIFNGPSTSGDNVLMIYRNMGNNTFSLQSTTNYLTFDSNTIDCGDYDNDGDQDFLLTSNTSTRIFQNKGGFIFTEQYSAGIEGLLKGTGRWGDYDNDGDLDIVISGRSGIFQGRACVYRNSGNGLFVLQPSIDLPGANGGSTEWGDYNNDGYLDLLLVGGFSNSIAKNNGNNTFSAQWNIIPNNTYTGSGKWGDLDNDGDLDIIIAGTDGTVFSTNIYINNGDNTFTQAAGILIDAVKDCSIDLTDYDGDKDLDILISGNKGTSRIVKVFRNDTPLINASPVAPTGLTATASGNDIILRWNPVTGDNTPKKSIAYNIMAGTSSGAINLVPPNSSSAGFRRISGMGNGQSDTTFILRNIKKGTYYWKVQAVDNSFKGSPFSVESSFTYSVSYQAYALKASSVGAKEATLTWARGNGTNCIVFMKEANTGTAAPVNNTTYPASSVFKTAGTQIGTTGWYCVAKGNITTITVTALKANTDYIFQVLEYDGAAGAEIYNTQTNTDNPVTFKTGSFTEAKSANLQPGVGNSFGSEQSSSSIWFDFDNDNDLDLLIVGIYSSKIYRNDLNDVFTLMPVTIASGYGAVCGDFNKDGWIDILVSSNPMHLYKNNGNSTFSELSGHGLPGNSYGSVYAADYDNDGDLDVSLTGETSTDGRITKVYRNNGDNTFTDQTTIKLDGVFGVNSMAKWGDYDSDGYPDLIVTGFDPSHTVIAKVYRNLGNNTFSEQKGIVLSTSFGTSYDWGDYDNDGDLDLLAANSSTYDFNIKSTIYRNDGVSLFTVQSSIIMSAAGFGSGSWGDYDGDGDLDVLMTGFTNGYVPIIKIYKNNGNNSFSEDLTCQIPGIGWSSSSWGDYDNDGDLDFVVQGINPSSAVAKIYRNDIGIVNSKPAAPVTVVAEVNKSDVTLKWKHVRSDNTPYKAMSYNVRVGTAAGGFNVVSPHANPTTGYRRVSAFGNASLDSVFTLKKLPMGSYFWSVQAVDNGFAGGTPSAEGTFSIVPVQAQNLSAKIINENTLVLKWDRGNGDRCVVFCKQASSGSAVPVNNTGYVADSEYGFGSQIGSSGWYTLYNGRADSVVVTGLSSNSIYSFHIFEYMGTFGSEQYFPQVVDGNPGVFSTSLFTEQTGITFNNNIQWEKIAWGDYDNDGFIDLIVPGFPSRIYRNKGDNTFIEKTAISISGISWGDVAWGDYDNDNDLDLIITGGTVNTYPPTTPATKLYRNDGVDIFTEQSSVILPQLFYSSVAWGDYDGDGDLDLLLTGATGESPNFNPVSKVYENNGNGSFSEKTQISLTGVLKGSGKWVDFDNDGDLDIAITGATDYQEWGNGVMKLYRNNGNKTFTDILQSLLPAYGYSNTIWGDYDNDGDPDVMLTSRGSFYLFENLGNSNFSQQIYISLAWQESCYAAWGDYDNDGFLDFILTNPGLDTKLFRNTQGVPVTGSISQWFNRQDDAALSSAGYEFVNWIDYDNEGDLDLLLARSNTTKIFKNNLIMKSGLFKADIAPGKPAGLKSTSTPSGVILKWNPVPGDETNYKTMTYNIGIGTTKTVFNISPIHSSSAGYRKLPAMGNVQHDTAQIFKHLASQKYYWSVQAVDQTLKGGAWSVVDSFEVKNTQAFFTFDTVCNGFQTHFTDQSVATDGIASRKWDFNDGSTSTLQNPVHQFATSGTFNVKLVVTSTTGTKDSLINAVIVKPRPLTDFIADPVCQGKNALFDNKTNYTGLTISSWYWNFGDGTISVLEKPVSHGYLGPGNYNVELKAAATNGCRDSITKIVSVISRPVAVITATSPLTFCNGDSVVLSVENNSNYSYQWIKDGMPQTGGTSNKFVGKSSGIYNVKIINLLAAKCDTTSTPVTVNSKEAPVRPAINPGNYVAGECPGENGIRLFVDQPVAGYSYQWFRNGVPIDNARSTVYEGFLDAGLYKVEAQLTGCRSESENLELKFNNPPAKPLLFPVGPVVWYIVCSNTDPGTTFRWYFNGNLIPDAKSNIYVAGKNLGNYYVIISNQGCFAMSDVITIPTGTTGIEDVDPFENLNLYPNPSGGLFNIEMDNQITGTLNISVIGQNGKEVMKIRQEKTAVHFSTQVDLTDQARGIYFISLSIDKFKSNRKIIIK